MKDEMKSEESVAAAAAATHRIETDVLIPFTKCSLPTSAVTDALDLIIMSRITSIDPQRQMLAVHKNPANKYGIFDAKD